jgi:ribonuclease HI
MDRISWHWEKDGDYSVRSAYHLLCSDRESSIPGPSSSSDDKLWKEIWKAKIPNKIKNFMWRLAKNILPTRANLLKKGIHLDASCPLCHISDENAQHLFMQCNLVKLAFFASALGCHPPLNTDLNCWILEWLTCSDILGAQLFCTILWKFWFHRNQVVFKNSALDPVRLVQDAMQAVHEFNEANKTIRPVQVAHGRRSASANTPLNFSMNVDAGCFANAQTGWGLVLRDHNGSVVLSACKRENIEVTPILAEALGLRWAIQTAISQGIHSISFSCDALGVVNCVRGKSKVAAIDSVIHDCRTLLDSIPSVMVNYVSRELNKEAHVLASMAKSLGSRTWLGIVPSNLAYVPVISVPVSLVQAPLFV